MIAVNPPASFLGQQNAVLKGLGKRYFVGDFPGPLSIKTVIRGRATWETSEGRYELGTASYLVLNEGQSYSITVEADDPVETFCVFFASGFVEGVCRSITASTDALVDDPWAPGPPCGFLESPRAHGDLVTTRLHNLRSALAAGNPDRLLADECLLDLASALLASEAELRRRAARLDAVRPSTRAELLRRLMRARDFAEDNLADSLALGELAREACLSPCHFHRLFAAAFDETPRAYVARRRVEKAARLLADTAAPITDVSLAVGFQSASAFNDLFRKRFGASPRAWRRMQVRKKPAESPPSNRGE